MKKPYATQPLGAIKQVHKLQAVWQLSKNIVALSRLLQVIPADQINTKKQSTSYIMVR